MCRPPPQSRPPQPSATKGDYVAEAIHSIAAVRLPLLPPWILYIFRKEETKWTIMVPRFVRMMITVRSASSSSHHLSATNADSHRRWFASPLLRAGEAEEGWEVGGAVDGEVAGSRGYGRGGGRLGFGGWGMGAPMAREEDWADGGGTSSGKVGSGRGSGGGGVT
jgi:hypothetical protein